MATLEWNPIGVEDGFEDDDDVLCERLGPRGFVCTRPDDHEGDHAAWTETELVYRWKRGH